MPIVFATTMANMIWSIGLEVTLAVLGFTNINIPTIGTMLYWANNHSAMVVGTWWWIAIPVVIVIISFVGLFLLAVSLNEYIDPAQPTAPDGGLMPTEERRHRQPPRGQEPQGLLPDELLRRRARSAGCRRHHACRSARTRSMASPGRARRARPRFIKVLAAAIRPPLRIVDGRGELRLQERRRSTLVTQHADEVEGIRWRHLSYIMQGSMSVLNPVRRMEQDLRGLRGPAAGPVGRRAPGARD